MSRNEEYLIKYLWKVPNERPIEMMGQFTEKRWEQFKKRPHPTALYQAVAVSEISRQLQEKLT